MDGRVCDIGTDTERTTLHRRGRQLLGSRIPLPPHLQSKVRILWVNQVSPALSLSTNILREVCGYLFEAILAFCTFQGIFTFDVTCLRMRKLRISQVLPAAFWTMAVACMGSGEVFLCGGLYHTSTQ